MCIYIYTAVAARPFKSPLISPPKKNPGLFLKFISLYLNPPPPDFKSEDHKVDSNYSFDCVKIPKVFRIVPKWIWLAVHLFQGEKNISVSCLFLRER